jgi:hypothetical protein
MNEHEHGVNRSRCLQRRVSAPPFDRPATNLPQTNPANKFAATKDTQACPEPGRGVALRRRAFSAKLC